MTGGRNEEGRGLQEHYFIPFTTAFGDKQADGRYDMRPSRIKYYVHKIPHLMFTFTS